jgi:NAD(P)-dependent dehydrogenase (short-subunit alcohol dehydrogenase family)
MTGVAFDFTGAQALVTGGTSGIGNAIAHAFADAGAQVTITGTKASTADYTIDLARFTYRQCRLTVTSDIDAVAGSLDGLDVLVNNAGQNLPGGRSEYEPDVFEETVKINLFGAYRMANATRELLAASDLDGGANVVNAASMASFFGIDMVPGYGAAKAGIVQLTKTLAVAWAAHGIRVNAVAPGVVETAMTAPMMPIRELTAPLLARTPMRRFAAPHEIAPPVLFLASPAAAYITGQTLAVDGGFSIAG